MASVVTAAELNPAKLLGSALKGGLKQGIANTVKGFPGMATMDKLASVMGLKPVSERINEKLGGKKGSLDQKLIKDRGADVANVQDDATDTIASALGSRTGRDIADESLAGAKPIGDSPVSVRSGRGMSARSAYSFAEDTDGNLGSNDAIGYLKNIEQVLHELWQLGDDAAKRDIEAAQDANEARGEKNTDAAAAAGKDLDTSPIPSRTADISEGEPEKKEGGGGSMVTDILTSKAGRKVLSKIPGVNKIAKLGKFLKMGGKAAGAAEGVGAGAAKSVGAGAAKSVGAGAAKKVGGKLLGRAALPIAMAMDTYSRYQKGQSATQIAGGVAGGGLGAYGGALAGAAIGSVVPVFGTVIGGLIGGALGYWAGGKVADKLTGAGAQPAAPAGGPAGGGGGGNSPTKEMIKKHEGTRYRPYKDTMGLWTVGVGHLIGDGKTLPPEMNREFSQAEVDTMFDEDYKKHAAAARGIPGYSMLGVPAQGALEDLTFNMGPKWYKKWPNFTAQLAAGDTTGAANNLQRSDWYGQVGPGRGNDIVSLIGNDPGKGGGASSTSPVPSSDRQATLSESSESVRATISGDADGKLAAMLKGGAPSSAGGSLTASNMGAGRTGSPTTPSPQPGPAAATRSAAAVSAGTAGLASAGAAAPMIVANIGGPPAPAAPSVTMMMPIPIPIRPRTEDMVLRAIQSVNYI